MLVSLRCKVFVSKLCIGSLLLGLLASADVRAQYVPPADQGANVPPPTLASKARGLTADGSNNDLNYCHSGYCISSTSGTVTVHRIGLVEEESGAT